MFRSRTIFYIAGRTSEVERVQDVRNCLLLNDHVIAFDWTVAGGLNSSESFSEGEARELAIREMVAASTADVTVLLWSDNKERSKLGALLEAGAALGNHRQLIVLDCDRPSIFWHLPNVTLMSTQEFKDAAATSPTVSYN